MAKFNVGDVVQLNSGGPDMTVAAVYELESSNKELAQLYASNHTKYGDCAAFYMCQWFNNQDVKERVFPEEMLDLVIDADL